MFHLFLLICFGIDIWMIKEISKSLYFTYFNIDYFQIAVIMINSSKLQQILTSFLFL